MALTYGFYNAANHDRKYDAVQISQLFDGLISDGVYATYLKSLIVIASETNDHEVIVQPGRAWFNHTWTYNDANLPITAPDPEVILDRIDALVLDVYSDATVRENSIIWVQGQPGSSDLQKPTLIHTDTHNQYPLCYVTRKAGIYSIVQADIENAIGTGDCPFVTGIIDTITTEALVLQWEGQWESWMSGKTTEFQSWFDDLRVILDGDVAANLAARILELENQMTADNTKIYMDKHDGKWGINTSPTRGADTFIPFKRAATETYSFPEDSVGELVDLGEDNEYRYIDASSVYAKGLKDGSTGDTAAGKIVYTYHHHTLNSTNNDSNVSTPGPYSDSYHAGASGGCFTKRVSYRVTGRIGGNSKSWGDGSWSTRYTCGRCGALCGQWGQSSDGSGGLTPISGWGTSSSGGTHVCSSGTYYDCSCGLHESQRIKAVIDFTYKET